MKTAIKFQIGSMWFCVENSRGVASGYPDEVTVTLRESRVNGRPGRRIEANPGTQRNEILALGLRLLDLADRMTPETTWSASRIVHGDGHPPRTFNLGAADLELVERLAPHKPLDFARHAYESAERLRTRMPILRAAQSVLEHCDNETANGLYVILAAADMYGRLPFRPELATAESGQSLHSGGCKDDTTQH
jgi:hypothetical protein